MDATYRQGRGAAWIVALVAAAALLAVGFFFGQESRDQELERLKAGQAAEASRANRLAAEHRSLEERLAGVSRQLKQCQESPVLVPPSGGTSQGQATGPGLRRSLRVGQAEILLDGRVVVTLEEVGGSPRRARIHVRVRGGKQGTVVLKPGGEVSFTVGRGVHRLLLKELHAASAVIILSAKP